MLATFLSALLFVLPQGGEQDPPVGLTVVMVDVGQGDGLVIRAPNGQVHVVDGGPNGRGTAAMLPAIDALQPVGYGLAFLSHFHDDHQGGLDEVLARPFQLVYDRGDLRRTNTSSDTSNYLAAAGARRRTVSVGAVYQLGGGATLRCIAANGEVVGLGLRDPTTSAQEENSRSVVLRLDYGQFSMWLGGDLTGGGSSTTDVESDAALACGDVDVYKLNHHGSNTSTNTNLVSRLSPELAIVSAGVGNSYGHPTTTIVNRLNQAAAARALLCTTTGAANVIGFAALGNIRIDTDGRRYRVLARNGDQLDFYVDEVAPSPLLAGSVRISEVHRSPARVPDTNGEYVEVVNTGARPLALQGLRLASNSGTITLASNYMLVPGRPLLFQVDGVASRNGGQPLGVPLPFGTIALGNTSDTVTLSRPGVVVDQWAYGGAVPGGVGVAAERVDLLGPNNNSNYRAAVTPFGAGDLGSPGRRNANDATVHPTLVDAAAAPGEIVLRGAALGSQDQWSAFGLAYAPSPGFPLLNATVPLQYDGLLQAFLGFAGAVAPLPAGGFRSLRIPLPTPNPLPGVPLYTAHLTIDLNAGLVTGVSLPFGFLLQ